MNPYNFMNTNQTLEEIKYNGKVMAIILRNNFSKAGVTFFTPEHFPQQLGFIAHRAGHEIKPHTHKIIPRQISLTQEVLFIKKGRIQVDFYTAEKKFLESRIVEAGDTILIAEEGHGYKVLEDIEMIEIKQGPYLGADDKILF